MLDFLVRYKHFILVLAVWLTTGILGGPVILPVIFVSVLVMARKKMYPELIMGFFLLIVLSDSRQYYFSFAKDAKNLYLILLTLIFIIEQKNFKQKSKIFYPFIPFLLLSFVLLAISPIQFFSMQKTVAYTLMFVCIPSYLLKIIDDRGEIILKDLIFFITLVMLIGILMIPVLRDLVYLKGRFTGILGNPNGVGILCTLFFILVSLCIHKFPSLINRNEMLLVYGVILFSIYLAGSRNTLFSIILFLVFIRFYKVSYWYGFVAVIVSIVVYQFLTENLAAIVEAVGLSEYLRVETIESGSGRLIAWAFAWEFIQKNFYFGKGIAYDEWVFGINQLKLNMMGHSGGVHNTYLSMWMNTGIVGLSLFLIGFFRTFFNATSKSYYALPVMFAVMFSITFESWLMGSLNPFTIVFLIIITLLYYEPSSQSVVPKN